MPYFSAFRLIIESSTEFNPKSSTEFVTLLPGSNLKEMGIKQTDDYRIFVYADSYKDGKDLSCINIRIADRKNRNRNINIPVYLGNGQRLKVNRKSVVEGTIRGNNDLNLHIDNLTNQILNFLNGNPVFEKKLIESVLYSDGFLDDHKQKRTRTILLPQFTDLKANDSFRGQYPKQKQLQSTNHIDTDGFLVKQEKEIILDPLSLQDFPAYFDKPLFDKLYIEYLKTERGQLNDPKYDDDPSMREIDNAWVMGDFKNYIQELVFEKQTVTGSITITKQAIEQYEQNHLKIRYASTGKPMLPEFTKKKLINTQRTVDITNMTTEEIYKNGYWDKNNIFEMFGSTYYDDSVNDTYTKIVVRLMEYREWCRPSENIQDFNSDWINSFFEFLKKNGWYSINTVKFDPLNYDPKLFFQNKERKEYQVKSLNKMKGIIKALTIGVKGEKTISFYKKKWIPLIDLSDVKYESEKKRTRIDHSLNKKEFDTLLHFKFDPKSLKKYQTIFDRINKSKLLKITIDDLNNVRDVFIIQTMAGGLRGYKEYSTIELRKSEKDYVLSFYQNKVTNTVINPLNQYTKTVLIKHKYKLPVVKLSSKSIDLKEQFYRSVLRTIANIINFDRDVLIDSTKNKFEEIKNLFGPYFARKTFGQIMYDDLNMRESDIAMFTGHADETETELGHSYINKKGLKTKIKFFEKIKIGKTSAG